jgi:hypothetical protein
MGQPTPETRALPSRSSRSRRRSIVQTVVRSWKGEVRIKIPDGTGMSTTGKADVRVPDSKQNLQVVNFQEIDAMKFRSTKSEIRNKSE